MSARMRIIRRTRPDIGPPEGPLPDYIPQPEVAPPEPPAEPGPEETSPKT